MARTINSVAKSRMSRWGRDITIGIVIFLLAVCVGSYLLVGWVEHQVLTTDNWVSLVSPLPKQPVIYTALGTFVSDRVFAAAPVEQRIAGVLPPKASFLAGPLTDQLYQLTTKVARKAVASDGFQTIWAGANRVAINRVVSGARGQVPPGRAKLQERFDINLDAVRSTLRTRLGSAATAIPGLASAKQQALTISANLHARRQRLHQAIQAVDKLNAVLPYAIAAAFFGMLALAWHRRRTAFAALATIFIFVLLELIGLRYGKQTVIDQIQNQANQPAVGYIYDVVAGTLRTELLIALAVVAVAAVILWSVGPSQSAVAVRRFLHLQRPSSAALVSVIVSVRRFVCRWEMYLVIAVVIVTLLVLALVLTADIASLCSSILLALAIISLIHIVATPRPLDLPRAAA